MKTKREGIKHTIDQLLRDQNYAQRLPELIQLPARRAINPLFAQLCNPDESVKMRAVRALGIIVGHLGEHDLESARVIMRRFMWNLNDESGCIGWGAPEAMGEIMAASERLAKEYVHVLVSYIREDGNYLEYEPLQRGVLWGLARLAEVRPHLLNDAATHIQPFLQSKDATLRGLALKILGVTGAQSARAEIESLLQDEASIEIFVGGEKISYRVSELARSAIQAP